MISDALIARMADELCGVPGVVAVALGGSRARGTHHAGSDVDLGVYYDAARFDVDAMAAATGRFADGGAVPVAGPGGWGPWVDGGAWLTVGGSPVDWILRDIDRVREQCGRAARGEFAFHPQPGHPLGFLDVSYAGEVATGHALADPAGVLAELAAGLRPYPVALRDAVVAHLWQADFLMAAARKGLPKRDTAYVLLCATTALLWCAHAWHAAAGSWPTNEKGLIPDVARLAVDSRDFAGRAQEALTLTATDGLPGVVDRAGRLVAETSQALSG